MRNINSVKVGDHEWHHPLTQMFGLNLVKNLWQSPNQTLWLPHFGALVLANQWPEIVTMCLVCWKNVVLCGLVHILRLVNGQTCTLILSPQKFPEENTEHLGTSQSQKKSCLAGSNTHCQLGIWRVASGFKKQDEHRSGLVGRLVGLYSWNAAHWVTELKVCLNLIWQQSVKMGIKSKASFSPSNWNLSRFLCYKGFRTDLIVYEERMRSVGFNHLL